MTIIEISTGKHPYSALRGVMELFDMILNEPPPNLPQEFDSDLRQLISVWYMNKTLIDSLSKDPQDRSTPKILLETRIPKLLSTDQSGTVLAKWAVTLLTSGQGY